VTEKRQKTVNLLPQLAEPHELTFVGQLVTPAPLSDSVDRREA
jgi:hypothetical protein